MKLTSNDIIAEIERLAAACPWDTVNIWTIREPEGKFRFTVYVEPNSKFGSESEFNSESSLTDAVDGMIKRCAGRDPEIAREKKMAELKFQIEKLQAVVIGMPPYRPNRELSNGEAAITVPDPVVEV